MTLQLKRASGSGATARLYLSHRAVSLSSSRTRFPLDGRVSTVTRTSRVQRVAVMVEQRVAQTRTPTLLLPTRIRRIRTRTLVHQLVAIRHRQVKVQARIPYPRWARRILWL